MTDGYTVRSRIGVCKLMGGVKNECVAQQTSMRAKSSGEREDDITWEENGDVSLWSVSSVVSSLVFQYITSLGVCTID